MGSAFFINEKELLPLITGGTEKAIGTNLQEDDCTFHIINLYASEINENVPIAQKIRTRLWMASNIIDLGPILELFLKGFGDAFCVRLGIVDCCTLKR